MLEQMYWNTYDSRKYFAYLVLQTHEHVNPYVTLVAQNLKVTGFIIQSVWF